LGSSFSWGTSSMGNGTTQCCQKFSEDTTGKDPCCPVPIHEALVNWLGIGVSSSSLLSSCVDHTHLRYGRICIYVSSIHFYSFWLLSKHNIFGKNKKTKKIDGCNKFIEWTDPDTCWLLWNININQQEKETQDANQRDFRILYCNQNVPKGPSPWKRNDGDDII